MIIKILFLFIISRSLICGFTLLAGGQNGERVERCVTGMGNDVGAWAAG